MTEELPIGAFVWTADGRELGRVKKSTESAFQVDAPLAFDYWLERDLVATVEPEKVTLRIANTALGGYKMDHPHDQDGFQDKLPAEVDPALVRDRNLLR